MIRNLRCKIVAMTMGVLVLMLLDNKQLQY